MKITKRQLRRIIKERVGVGNAYNTAHPRAGLGRNVADVEFPILVRYRGQSEVLYDQDSLDELLDDLGPDTPYSLDSLSDVEPVTAPAGRGIEMYGESRVLKEYSDYHSLLDAADYIDDISEMLDMLADKYVTSGWLKSQNNAITDGVAERIEKLYRDSESLGSLIRGSGILK